MNEDSRPDADGGQADGGPAVVAKLDLTNERLDDAAASTLATSLSGQRESTRSHIAYALLGVLIITSAGWVLVGVFAKATPADDAFDTIFTGILGLTGTVVGFYFGSASQEKKD